MRKFLNRNTFLIVISLLVITLLLYISIPLVIKEFKLKDIQKDIERVEAKIERNKQERLNCDANMRLRNDENNDNRKMIDELKNEYNSIVGFTSDWVSQ